jgi:hypothetical protein
VEPILEHTAQAGALTAEALEAALTLHGEKMAQKMREALTEAIPRNAEATASAIRTALEDLEPVVTEAPETLTGENGSEPGESTHLELESTPAIAIHRKRAPALMRMRRR